ncbi:hypothetical protein MBOT_19780 [Mycobacterium botniense]|uniref:Uncharacterized protein n=1 Tax=Mycobacterium botniense TaxID=84962 RepID=A0A7I9XXV4_9MYCO|nr:hypothetical protein MBOT_19780 [Mycobacterium botniense]
MIEEFQIVVAGNPEDFGNPELRETIEQIVANGIGVADSSHVTTVRSAENDLRPAAGPLSCGPWQSGNPAKS